MTDPKQLISFEGLKTYFHDDDICRRHLFNLCWPGGFRCPECGHDGFYDLTKRSLLQCKRCKYQTSVTAGTLMRKTRIPLRYWFWGIYYVAACNGETTAQQLSEKIGLNYHAARRMLGKIHEIEKNQGFMEDLLKSFKMPERSREEISTGPGMETPPRPIKEQTISDQKKPEIPGYLLEEVIFESGRTWLCRGRRQSDGLWVLIKGAASSQQSAQELAEIRHEHEITQALEIDGVLKSEELVQYENGSVLILENNNALPLRKLMDAARFDLLDSLKAAISLIGILKEVHQQGILHKMINPFNIFVDPASGNIKLTGFGLATRLPEENLTTLSPQLSGETLPYISPEQTGRMNRVLDYRSDFYSLGVTLYELFTGRVPFYSREAMEIIHAHIARQPPPPDEIEPQVPRVLSNMVMKLMAKRAEARYQSHSGLTADLLACLEQLENQGSLSDFPLGRQDVLKELQIAPGLYGREDEITALEDALERVSQGATEMMLISGSAGVGKTALVGEIHRSVAQKNGFFISGKFDQLRHNIPYSALIQALRGLTREIQVEDKSGMERWKSRIRAALGPNGQLVTRVIPELEQVIGPQPLLPEMGALEARNRFTAVLLDFIGLFCEKTHPLVIFLDDLQWVDVDTLKLVERIAQDPERKPLLFLGAYRDNEVEADHRLTISCEVIKKTGQSVQIIPLKPLDPEDISQLLVHTCHCRPEDANPLAEVLVRKTGGNPFFVGQFLTVLSEKELIGYSPEKKRWTWELAAIEFLAVTDNVVDLLIDRLHRFSFETRKLLSLAACIGNTFDLESLELISGAGSGEIDENLLPALENGLILGFSQAPELDNPLDGASAEGGSYKFLHDRVQQAAYALIAQKEKQTVHLQIGQTLLKQYAPGKSDALLFDIVHHLNLARGLKDKWKDRLHLAELNLEAGRQARAASAFEQALEYFTLGLDLLGAAAWKWHYPLALSLHEAATEMSSLCGRFELMEKLAGAVKDNAREDPDLANVYRCRIQAYTTRGKLKKALEMGEEILEKLGCQLSRLSLDQWQQTLVQIKSSLVGKSVEDVMRFEPLTQPHAEFLVHILSEIHMAYGLAGITLDDGLWHPITLKRISLLLNHFHPQYSPEFYSGLGGIYCEFMQDFEFGYELGRLSIQLMEALDLKEINCRVSGVFNRVIRFYREPLSASLDPLLEAHKMGIETGDFYNAGNNAVIRCQLAFMCGKELNWLKGELSTLKLALKKIDYIIGSPHAEMLMKTITILMEEPASLSSGIMDQYDRGRGAEYNYYEQSNFNYQKLVLQTLFEEYEAARETAFEMIILMKTYKHALIDPLANCYLSLALLAVCDQGSEGEKKEILNQVDDNQDTLEKLARCAPPNYLHKYHLVEAERLRVLEGQSDTIMHHYDQAIALARESEFIHEEALANELAARYLLNQGQNDAAQTYLRSAMEQYEAWGTKRKVAHLKSRYPGLIADDRAEGAASPSANLDLTTMLKASEAISSTLELEPLLEILLGILMENAGAQTAALILETEGRSLIAARGSAEQVECFLPLSLPVEKAESLSLSVISWVKQTREHLVLDNASQEERFVGDDYIKKERPKSILCAPIHHKSALSGIIYLENNLVEGAFTSRRLEVIKHLTSQVAISLENARLYDNMKRAEAEYRGIFENATEGIYRTSQDGRFLSANPAMARIFGYSSPDELMASINDVGNQHYVNPEQRHQFLDLIRQRRPVSDFEVKFFRKDGSTFWASLHARPVYDETDALRFIEGIISDVTEQKNRMEALHKENVRLRSNIKERYRFGKIIGKSPVMQEIYELILKAAASNVGVIVYGESGTGKELVAKAIHEMSDRKEKPFVPVNAGAVPENLLESEFFGYKKGAFTGANADKRGLLQQADKGTLFLDELGEIGPNLQAKLLRAIEGGGFTPVGGLEAETSDFRIIAATNQDLKQQMKKGLMRKDFFYRIHIIPLHLPPLRERKEDIPLLIEHFMQNHPPSKNLPTITLRVMEALTSYDWPGNVRELQNTLYRYVTLGEVDFLGEQTIAPGGELSNFGENPRHGKMALDQAVADSEKATILSALKNSQGHKVKTAATLGISRATLFNKMKKYGIRITPGT